MIDGLRAQLSSSTIIPIAIVGLLAWDGWRSDQDNKALLQGFQAKRLGSLTLNDCSRLTYRTGEYFPALCTQVITRVDSSHASGSTGHHFSSHADTRELDDRMLEVRCYDVACKVVENYPQKLLSADWSAQGQCWTRREFPWLREEGPYQPRVVDETSFQTAGASAVGAGPPTLPRFRPAPDTQPMGRLASTNCAT